MSSSDSSRPKPKRSSRSSTSISSTRKHTRFSQSLPKVEIIINVYDLLPSGVMSKCLWPLGLSLLHTGVVINDREYAYGAAVNPSDAGSSGIFWTRPRPEQLGATFRCSILQGFTYLAPNQIEEILIEAGGTFRGDRYNLLAHNCNHFTDHLCRVLTNRSAPAWINRASRVGTVLPCLVPRGWIDPPDVDDGETDDAAALPGVAGGRYEDEEDDGREHGGEQSSMLRDYTDGPRRERSGSVQDTSGRQLPRSEQIPQGGLI